MTEPLYKDLHFPKAGLDVSQAFSRQPNRQVHNQEYARTAPVGLNVRAYDRLSTRNRGGSRAGIVRLINAKPLGSTWLIQGLNAFAATGISHPGGGTLQASQQGRVITGVVVQQGNLYTFRPGDTGYTSATNATGATPAMNASGLIYSAPNNQKLYLVDGSVYRYYDPDTNTVYNWTASTAGTLPVDEDDNYCRLICTWRGRTVLSGLEGEPQNVFMSRVSDPHDFDYSPTNVSETDPVALNASQGFGLVGDAVTCLIPYSDDVLIIGCTNSIYKFQGDPMAGGEKDLVTDAVGMAWGVPWCRDGKGVLYFFSSRPGVYAMVPGQQPVRISRQIDPLLADVNTGTHTITMAYDHRYDEVRVFISPTTAPDETTHYTYEVKNQAWWQDQFADTDFDPLCCCTFDGNRDEDRVILLGSWNGYIHAVDPTATKDVGQKIASEVVIGPILTKNYDELALDQLQAVLGEESGAVTCEVLAGPTAEAALAADPVDVGVLEAGRSLVFPIRVRGHALYVRLTADEAWQLEMIRVRLQGKGKVGMRQR